MEKGCVEFLDLSGIEEQERNWLLSSLYSHNPKIQLPWYEDSTCSKTKKYEVSVLLHQQRDQSPHTTELLEISENRNSRCPDDASANAYDTDYTNNSRTSSYGNTNEYFNVNGNTNNVGEHITNGDVYEENVTPSVSRKSWASLFNKNNTANLPNETTQKAATLNQPSFKNFNLSKAKGKNSIIMPSLKEPFKSNSNDPNLHRMGEYLSSCSIDSRIISLHPRGLINKSNYCYINSILQAVLACPPVYNLLNGLVESVSTATEMKKIVPVIDSMTKLVKEFHHLPAGLRVGRRLDKNQKKEQNVSISCEFPFEPVWIHKLLSGTRNDIFVVEGRQEDAEEFLGCLLNGLNDEMLELMKLAGIDTSMHTSQLHQEEDKEWQVMGPKNKGAITRRTEFTRTPISNIFGGLLRSRLHRTGDQSTDNIQPFFTLQLNIEKAKTVKEALDVLVCKNQLEGVTSSKTNEEVEAWQQVTLEELPIVLVLHLKCFDYKLDGCSKIIKALEFPIDLKIDSKLLSSKTNYSVKERQYKLFAVVYHEGKEASKGHYVTDAYHVGYASWVRYDDASVKSVSEDVVLKPQGTRVPYLLFYRRSDSLSKNK